MFWNTGVELSTAMEGKAIPRMPSNLASMNVEPGCWIASPNVWLITVIVATLGQCEGMTRQHLQMQVHIVLRRKDMWLSHS